MKSKLRNIIVHGSKFKYLLNEKYVRKEKGETYWKTTLRVFKDGFKKNPLEIQFESKDEYITGNPLTSNTENRVNLHRPLFIRKIIEYGIKEGWDWENQGLIISDGFSALEKRGCE